MSRYKKLYLFLALSVILLSAFAPVLQFQTRSMVWRHTRAISYTSSDKSWKTVKADGEAISAYGGVQRCAQIVTHAVNGSSSNGECSCEEYCKYYNKWEEAQAEYQMHPNEETKARMIAAYQEYTEYLERCGLPPPGSYTTVPWRPGKSASGEEIHLSRCLCVSQQSPLPTSTMKTLKAYFTYSVSGLTVTFDASGSTGDFQGMRDIDVYWWECKSEDGTLVFLDRGGPILTHEFMKPGTYVVKLTVKDKLGNADSLVKKVDVGVASINISITPPPPIKITNKPQELDIEIKVVNPNGEPAKAFVSYDLEFYAERFEPLSYKSGSGETDDHGTITFRETIEGLYYRVLDWCKKKGVDPLNFRGTLKVKASAEPTGWESWRAEKTEEFTVTFKPPEIAVTVYMFNDDKNLVTSLQYVNEYKTKDFELYRVHLKGEVRSDYPIAMKLLVYSNGERIPLDESGRLDELLGTTPIYEKLYTKVSVWPKVYIQDKGDVTFLLYKDMANEAFLMTVRTFLILIPGGRVSTGTILAYDIFVKIRNSVITKFKSGGFSLWDLPGLTLAEIGEHEDEVIPVLKKVGLEATKEAFGKALTAAGLILELGHWTWDVYNTPSEAQEKWIVAVREAES